MVSIFARTYLPIPLHGPDCFLVSTLYTYTDLSSREHLSSLLYVYINLERNRSVSL